MTLLEELELPAHLRERTRLLQGAGGGSAVCSDSQFVLYWLRTAVRSDENPALDVACWLADRLDLPLLVYHAISEDYEYASDRHHRFMLEGARDIQEQFSQLGISYAFHLANRQDRSPYLLALARKAAWLVTEDMPVDPPRRFLKAVLEKTKVRAIVVDSACVVPMQVVGRAYTRAFEFRSATESEYRKRVGRTWPVCPVRPKQFRSDLLPFKPLDISSADIGSLIADCDIDHSVGPIAGTEGGSTAGYARWRQFLDRHISAYDKKRNSPLLNGVSRLSPYLHYGMVSPMRIAREASSCRNSGSHKFLDELLIWRELAYCYCQFTPDYDSFTCLPEWARQTLMQHANDPRPMIYTWEQLARGETDDSFWNTAQHSLLMAGELHNNVRMTWGKALLNWTRSPEEAWKLMVDLNHRYALDGRDPASYGGLLWCLGQFDRPFHPSRPIFGTVRPRSTDEHAQRLSVDRYRQHVHTLNPCQRPRVAVIGAGIAGLMAARTLTDHGLPVTVFDKSRGVGGRMATRRTEQGWTFDHGAQYFTVRDSRFQRYVDSWEQMGIVAKWPDSSLPIVVLREGAITPTSESAQRYVGTPSMTAIPKHLATRLSIELGTTVSSIRPVDADQIELLDATNKALGRFQRIVVAVPSTQAALLLQPWSELRETVACVDMQPCWALMVGFANRLAANWSGAFIHDSLLSWACRNGNKPGRAKDLETLVLHASPAWSRENLELDSQRVGELMLEEFWRVSGIPATDVISLHTHRWRYASLSAPLTDGALESDDRRVVVCGDWCNGARVEGAFLSGCAAAGKILNRCERVDSLQEQQLTLF